MKTNLHPFEPSFKPVFSKRPGSAALLNQEISRNLFYGLIHISEHYDILSSTFHFIEKSLNNAKAHYQHLLVESIEPDDIRLPFIYSEPPWSPEGLSRESLNKCLAILSPVILTSPAWLQNISQAVSSQTQEAVMLMSVYKKLIYAERGDTSLEGAYRSLLLDSGIEIPALHTRAFTLQKEIPDCIFDFAALQLSLARFPRTFFPEILGFTLAYCQSQFPAESFFSIEKLRDLNCPTHFFTARCRLLRSQISSVNETIRTYLDDLSELEDPLNERIEQGIRLYQHQTERCNLELKQHLLKTQSPRQALANLLQQKAGFAFGHHKQVRLGGKTLDEWFGESPFDTESFLAALKHSPYVDSQNPQDSRILKLFEFNGPMFGVFSPSEKNILENWLMTQAQETQQLEKPTHIYSKSPPTVEICLPSEYTGNLDFKYSKLKNRELYYYLLNAELFPEVLDTARRKVKKTLRSAEVFGRLPFKRYTHEAFDHYIHSLYRKEIDSYQPLKGKPALSKEAYKWGIEQLAPVILIDGCWLQEIGQLRFLTTHEIGNILFHIYRDEIGDGILRQNHPSIYRQLLESLNMKLPPVHTKEFSAHGGFIDSAFDLPVYLLSISHFPGAFLPEILGLNMAIELSGLGKTYLRLSEELKFWGIDPTIVNLHISIDNFASGHSAMAKDAIQLYLDEISACSGESEMHRHWHRIYTGYCSLESASRYFKISMVSQYLIKKAGRFFRGECSVSNKLLQNFL